MTVAELGRRGVLRSARFVSLIGHPKRSTSEVLLRAND